MTDDTPQDGRHARRERSRAAIIEAVFDLVQEGKVPPQVEDVALRAGVSVSSVFRNFDGLADLQHQAFVSFHEKFAALLVVDDADRLRPDRIRSHVRTRVELIGVAGGLMRVGRARALDHEPMVEGLALLRSHLAEQTRQRFAAELSRLTPAESANLAALIDATTSPDAYDVMSAAHARTPIQIGKTWIAALDAVLTQWTPPDDARRCQAPTNASGGVESNHGETEP